METRDRYQIPMDSQQLDQVFQRLCQRNDGLDQRLAALLGRNGLTAQNLEHAAQRVSAISPEVVQRISAATTHPAHGDLSWSDLRRSAETHCCDGSLISPGAHWIRL